MIWKGDLGLELFVATKRYGRREDYIHSQWVLNVVEKYGLRGRVDVIPLDSLNGQRSYFHAIKEPEAKIKLPFLVTAHGCETGAVLGHSGLEQVLEILNSLLLNSIRNAQN